MWVTMLSWSTSKVGAVDLVSGDFVKKGESIASAAVATGKGTSVIDTTAGNLYAADEYTPAAVNADLTLSAAVKLDVNTTNAGSVDNIVYTSQPSGKPVEISDGSADVYVVPGTVIEVTGTDVVTVEDSEGEIEITGDNRDDAAYWVKLTVGTDDLVFGNP